MLIIMRQVNLHRKMCYYVHNLWVLYKKLTAQSKHIGHLAHYDVSLAVSGATVRRRVVTINC